MTTVVVKSIKAVGGDYATIAEWEIATRLNLVALDQIQIGELYKETYDGVTIQGATTDGGHYRQLRASAGCACKGIPGAGPVVTWFVAQEDYFLLQDVEYASTGPLLVQAPMEGVLIERCLVKVDVDRNGGSCVTVDLSGGVTMEVRNCILINTSEVFSGRGIIVNGDPGDGLCRLNSVTVYGNGIYGPTAYGVDVFRQSIVQIQNVVSVNNGRHSFWWHVVDGWQEPTQNNASDDDRAPGSDSLLNKTLEEIAFVDAVGLNLHIQQISCLREAGVVSIKYDDDIDGDTRVAPWDIGADEWIAPPLACAPVSSVTAAFSSVGQFVDVGWEYEGYPGSEWNKFRVKLLYEDPLLPGWWHKLAEVRVSGILRAVGIPIQPLWRKKWMKVTVTVICKDCCRSVVVESEPFHVRGWLDMLVEDFEYPDWGWGGLTNDLLTEDFETW